MQNDRVAGQLAISRALGDHLLKNSGVSSEPFTTRLPLASSDEFLVIGSDGLWDVVPEDLLMRLRGLKAQTIAQRLTSQAIESGSRDNICVLVVAFL